MPVKKIKQRTVNGKTYELVCYLGGPTFAIYEIKSNAGDFKNYPRIASFDNEKDANEYLEKL